LNPVRGSAIGGDGGGGAFDAIEDPVRFGLARRPQKNGERARRCGRHAAVWFRQAFADRRHCRSLVSEHLVI
jgi:hypothetical protein